VTAIGLLVLGVTITPVTEWWAKALSGPIRQPAGDLMVVLGGDQWGADAMGSSSYLRALQAASAYRRGKCKRILLTGGGRAGLPIVEPMRDYLTAQGVPASAIQTEVLSNSTRENALYTRQIIGIPKEPVLILSSDIHMFRARRAFTRVGIETIPYPTPDAIYRARFWLNRWQAFLHLTLETTKIVYYFARGWI